MRILSPLFIIAVLAQAQAATAHELWLEPLDYQVANEGQLKARILNGEEFVGTALPYLPQRFRHFVVSVGDRNVQVPGRPGDAPGLNMSAQGEGLHVVAYQSKPQTITYQTWEKFQKFVDHKDFGDVRPLHDARGLPAEGFKEAYVRYSKTLIGVGNAAGADKRMGLETELVALTNPYTDDLSGGMKVQLYYGQEVRANEQVEVFSKAPGGRVTVTLVRTDANGIATIPVSSGTSYQLDAVVLREPDATMAQNTGAVWETLWANLTFEAP
ncbi:MAG: DUF4198 domain-containing protein [Pseudomonadota bacterium]